MREGSLMRSSIGLLILMGSSLFIAGCVWLQPEIHTDYNAPLVKVDEQLADDNPAGRPVLPFDAALVDPRPLDGWLINNSAAVFKLDVSAVKPDQDLDLETLYPSHAAACKAAHSLCPGLTLFPSVNMLDGKAKQFDDGLYAAIDLASYHGLSTHLRSHVDLIKAMHAHLTPSSPAANYLATGLELAGVLVPCDRVAKSRGARSLTRTKRVRNRVGSIPGPVI